MLQVSGSSGESCFRGKIDEMTQTRGPRSLVIGGYGWTDDDLTSALIQDVNKFGVDLGKALVENDIDIVIGGSFDLAVHIMNGATQACKARGLSLKDQVATYHTKGSPPKPGADHGRLYQLPDDDVFWTRVLMNADIVIAISGRENTKKVLHLAQVLGKPTFPVGLYGGAAEEAWASRAQAGIDWLGQRNQTPSQLALKIATEIKTTYKSPDTASSTRTDKALRTRGRRRVFLSYSHADREYLNRILVHLKPLEAAGLIEVWVDKRLTAGDRWKKEIETALQSSAVAIVLVSADFLASDFILNNELPPILARAERDGTRVIPIIIKPCRFDRYPKLSCFQALNRPEYPLSGLSETEREVTFDSLAKSLEETIGGVSGGEE
jgi:hypothetical protein